jgi:hypothetical protein
MVKRKKIPAPAGKRRERKLMGGENYTRRSFKICTLDEILLG